MIIYTYRNYVENVYTYKYDSDGIRTSKTINGVTTNYDIIGTTVLAQYDAENEILFQYNGSTPIGFVLNDVQYLYITNQSGDVRGITDAQGNLIAQYAYDEWGKLLSIDAENEENRAVAEINPLRYRGYYYDNETGLYYLQSRYYNPEWCRFISADGFGYINTNRPLNINAYVYCVNNPILYVDPSGNAYVSDAGKAISDFIGIWFLSLEAQERLGDDFAAFVATIFTLDPSLMHFDIDIGETQKEKEERKEQAQKEFFEFFDNLTNEFAEFMKSTFYIMTSSIKGFYLDFFNTCIQNRSLTGSVSITRYLKITFGYGDEDGFISILDDLLHGRIKVLELGNVSIGGIKSNSGIGVFFDYTQSIIGKFFANISFDFNFDIHNLFPPNSGFPVLNEEPGYIIITCLLLFFSLFSAGDTART